MRSRPVDGILLRLEGRQQVIRVILNDKVVYPATLRVFPWVVAPQKH